jgi:hypothetical protein
MPIPISDNYRNQHLPNVHLDGRLRRWRNVGRMRELFVAGLEGGIVRRKLGSRPVLFGRGDPIARSLQSLAQIEMRDRLLRLELCALAELGHGAWHIAAFGQHYAQQVVYYSGIRSKLRRFAQLAFRAGQVLRATQRVSQMKSGGRHFRIESHRTAQERDRFAGLARLGELDALRQQFIRVLAAGGRHHRDARALLCFRLVIRIPMHGVQFASRVAGVYSHSRGQPKDGFEGSEFHRNQGNVRGYGFEGGSLYRRQQVQPETDNSFGGGVDPCKALQWRRLAIGTGLDVAVESGPIGALRKCHDKAILPIGILPAEIAETRLPLVLRKKIIQQSKKAREDQEVAAGGRLDPIPGGCINSKFFELLRRGVRRQLDRITKSFAPAGHYKAVFETHLMDIFGRREIHKLREHAREILATGT